MHGDEYKATLLEIGYELSLNLERIDVVTV